MRTPWDEKINTVDLKALRAKLADGGLPDESVAELLSFGSFLLSSLQQRIEGRKQRAITMIGWSLAALAFCFAVTDDPRPIAVVVAAGIAIFTISLGGYAAWRDKHAWFSSSGWFWAQKDRSGFTGLDDPQMLAKYHVVQLAEIHEQLTTVQKRKSEVLLCAEVAMVLCGVTLAAGLIWPAVAPLLGSG